MKFVHSIIAALGFAVLVAAPLSACSDANVAATTATVDASVATADAKVQSVIVKAQKAVAFYGEAKGIAQIAELAKPNLKPVIDPIIAKLDPIVAQINADLTVAGTVTAVSAQTVTNITDLVASLNDQAIDLQNAAASTVSVVAAAK